MGERRARRREGGVLDRQGDLGVTTKEEHSPTVADAETAIYLEIL